MSLPRTNISPVMSTRRLFYISRSMYPIAATDVKRVHGSRIIRKPSKSAVKIFIIFL